MVNESGIERVVVVAVMSELQARLDLNVFSMMTCITNGCPK